jgi:hypothetical protein
MKQRFFFVGVLMFACALAAFAQNNKPNLAVLAFTGGQRNEGETVAELFSFDRQLMNRFGVLVRTSITKGIEQEYDFQKFSGMVDPDTIAILGKQLGAEYVMAGSITGLGGQKMLVVVIIKIETGQQVAGHYLLYTTEEELADQIPGVIQNLLPMLDVDTSGMEKLAIPPVQLDLNNGDNERDANTLAQILSIEIMRNRSYAIYPRTEDLDQVRQEFDTQHSGVTDYQQAAQLGRGENPRLVLSVAARRLGASNRFNAFIIEMERGTQVQGTSEVYTNMRDGITVMGIIARVLSGQDVSEAEQQRRSADITSAANREDAARKHAEALDKFNSNAGLVFALQLGTNLVSKDFVSERIFSEPKPETEYQTVTDQDTGVKSKRVKEPSTVGFPMELLAGFRYSWFSINTGASFGLGYDGPSRIDYSVLQVPVFLRGEWGSQFKVNIFGGIGFNIPLKATAALAQYEDGPTRTQSASLAMSPSVIFGGGVGSSIGENILLSIDIRGVVDTAETMVELVDGRTGSFKRTSFDVMFGIKFQMSFLRAYSGTRPEWTGILFRPRITAQADSTSA